jgi:hypothetical protein
MKTYKNHLKEAKVPQEFMEDPLYKAVLTAKNEKEFKKALDTLMSVRGSSAVTSLQNAIKKGSK